MNSLTASAPTRVAPLKPYLCLAARSYPCATATTGLRYSSTTANKRSLSSTPQKQINEFFPPPKAPHIREVETPWVHPV